MTIDDCLTMLEISTRSVREMRARSIQAEHWALKARAVVGPGEQASPKAMFDAMAVGERKNAAGELNRLFGFVEALFHARQAEEKANEKSKLVIESDTGNGVVDRIGG